LGLKEFDPVAAGVIDKSKGIMMHSDVDAQLTSDGTTFSSTGKIKASGLQLVQRGLPALEPVDIDYSLSKNLQTRTGVLSDVAIHAGSAEIHANGSFQLTQQGTTVDLHVNAPGLPIDQVGRLLPVVGIHLPSGSSLQGGTLTADIAVTGPMTEATLAGPVQVDNTKLVGFDLGSRIQGLSPISGTGDATAIQVLKAKVSSSAEGSRITEIACNLPQLGLATGEGSVAQTGAIDFNLNAKLNPSKETPSSRAIPLTITGTAVNPLIKANGAAPLK
jgi:AsmA protein